VTILIPTYIVIDMGTAYIITSDFDRDEWEEYVQRHPLGNVFQTPQLYDVYQNTKNYRPIKLFAIEQETGRLCGVLSAVLVKEMGGPIGFLSAHSIIQGGPLESEEVDGVVSSMLIAEHDRLTTHKALYSEIRNLNDRTGLLRNASSYHYEDHLNFLICLDNSKENIWHSLNPRRRNNINRATKNNIVCRELKDQDELDQFYETLKRTYARARIPLADATLFMAAFHELMPLNRLRIFLAIHGDTVVAGRAILLYKQTMYDWYAGSLPEGLSLYANDCLVWHALRWGVDNGYRVLDFGGAGNPSVPYGPREFKRQFGGQQVNYGRYVHICSPAKTAIANLGLKIFQNVGPR
jgi:serine/alanine adding enzyme